MLVTLNDHLAQARLLLPLEVAKWTSDSVNDIILWLNWQVLWMLLMGHWRPKLIRICHHSGVHPHLELVVSVLSIFSAHTYA